VTRIISIICLLIWGVWELEFSSAQIHDLDCPQPTPFNQSEYAAYSQPTNDILSKLFVQNDTSVRSGIELIVLGTVQDAGSPHAGCKKDCCKTLFLHPDSDRMVVSLGLIDHDHKKTYLFEASPDLPRQMEILQRAADLPEVKVPNGIFLTHAHIGHYTGLMYLGRESLGSDAVPVYTMPKMTEFLKSNGPWDQLIALSNISLRALAHETPIRLSAYLTITPFLVPHRDEYSETVGFRIEGPNQSVLFIPDINKWHVWKRDILEEIKNVDFAFVDATFYNNAEIPHRDMSEIPHPFVAESMELFKILSEVDKAKVQFIHLNHTNPLLDMKSPEYHQVVRQGYQIARFGQRISL
jgi:pyrroloquinoline quinone biosynthesis protein B